MKPLHTNHSGPAAKLPRTARIQSRVTRRAKNLIEQAARRQGLSTSEFIEQWAMAGAERVLGGSSDMTLSEADQRAFVRALLKPPRPNAALRAAARAHARRVKSDS